jgi:hypothetical protein
MDKSKEQLIDEIKELRERLAELELSQERRKQADAQVQQQRHRPRGEVLDGALNLLPGGGPVVAGLIGRGGMFEAWLRRGHGVAPSRLRRLAFC